MAVTHLPAGNVARERRELLRAALGRMRRVTGLPVTFGGEVPAGGRGVRLTEFAGTRTDVLSGLVINAGNGLAGGCWSPPGLPAWTTMPRTPASATSTTNP